MTTDAAWAYLIGGLLGLVVCVVDHLSTCTRFYRSRAAPEGERK